MFIDNQRQDIIKKHQIFLTDFLILLSIWIDNILF